MDFFPSGILQHAANLRMVVDKFQKQSGFIEPYADEDLVSWLQAGLICLNAKKPSSKFLENDVPSELAPFLLLYALRDSSLTKTDSQKEKIRSALKVLGETKREVMKSYPDSAKVN